MFLAFPSPRKPYSTQIVFICSNEEPQQACDGKFPCYIKAFSAWANATKSAAVALGVWPLSVGVALASGAGRSFTPGSQDPYRGGATELLEAIKAADLGDAQVCVATPQGWLRSLLSDVWLLFSRNTLVSLAYMQEQPARAPLYS